MSMPPPGQWPPPQQHGPMGSPFGPPRAAQQPGGGRSPDAPAPRPRRAKWWLGGLVLLTVVTLAVVSTLLITRDGSTAAPQQLGPPRPASPPVDASQIASADDNGPVGVITEDATCPAWAPIADTFSARAAGGWNERDVSIPASTWTTAQRAQHEEIAEAMRSAANATVALVKMTPHRLMRQLYEQAIAYWRAYADAIPTYRPKDDSLARVATSASNAISYICSAITYGSAAARGPLVSPSPAPPDIVDLGDPENPARYVTNPLSICTDWLSSTQKFDDDTQEWLNSDPNIPASQWSPEQQSMYQRTALVMQKYSDELQNLGAQSLNSVFDDFAALATQYRRAFVQSFPTYTSADAYLANASAELAATNSQACSAAGAN